ncbi:Uncharacterised protein [Enterobacter asburiae]|uniref:Uncharacterized protein n=1 Tax=Enterobacter asburiae TaxID=61645 RepID=A0A376F4G0_ENTAS|nr:Uncharacterised protein [Enterobacter asburiae]
MYVLAGMLEAMSSFELRLTWCDTGAKIKKDGDNFVISLKRLSYSSSSIKP